MTQKTKIKTTKAPSTERKVEEQIKKLAGENNESPIRKLSLAVPEISTKKPWTANNSTVASNITKSNDTNLAEKKLEKNFTTPFVGNCSSLGMGKCNMTASVINSTDSTNNPNRSRGIVVAEIEVEDTNQTIKVIVPIERGKNGKKSHNTKENALHQESEENKAGFVNDLTEIDENSITNSTRAAELKKRKKISQKKAPTKRKVNKKKNPPKRKVKKEIKVKRSKSPNAVNDTSAH